MPFWFFMCLSPEGHIRVATLRNHIIQNNAFTKLVFEEEQLPDFQALTMLQRLGRFLSYLLITLVCASFSAVYGMSAQVLHICI